MPPASPTNQFGGTPEKSKAESARSAPSGWLARTRRNLARVLLGLTLGWGGVQVAGRVVADGTLPQFNSIADTHEDAISRNTTYDLYLRIYNGERPRREEWWEALAPTLQLVRALAPAIADDLEDRYRTGRLRFNPPSMPKRSRGQYLPALDEIRLNANLLVDTDGEKAAVLIHEYRHSRQSFLRSGASLTSLSQLRSWVNELLFCDANHGGWGWYGTGVEDEAYAYERDALLAMGLPEDGAAWYFDEYHRQRPWKSLGDEGNGER